MFSKLVSVYRIEGVLTFKAPFHIGGGLPSSATDSPVVRYANGMAYIPGSSLKGVLRSTVESLCDVIYPDEYSTCRLIDSSMLEDDDRAKNCLSVSKDAQKDVKKLIEEGAKEAEIAEFVFRDGNLCDTCRLFGSPYSKSKVAVRDLLPKTGGETGSNVDGAPREIRDGVGIDRVTGTAADRLKYDFEVVPLDDAYKGFDLVLEVINPSEKELKLLAIGLAEFAAGRISLGGITSRGLGACGLNEKEVKVSWINFGPDKAATLAYLRNSIYPNSLTLAEFLDQKLVVKTVG